MNATAVTPTVDSTLWKESVMFHNMDQELARARHVERMQLLQPEYSNRFRRALTGPQRSTRRSLRTR